MADVTDDCFHCYVAKELWRRIEAGTPAMEIIGGMTVALAELIGHDPSAHNRRCALKEVAAEMEKLAEEQAQTIRNDQTLPGLPGSVH